MTSGSRYHFVQSQESEFRINVFLDKIGQIQKTSIGLIMIGSIPRLPHSNHPQNLTKPFIKFMIDVASTGFPSGGSNVHPTK